MEESADKCAKRRKDAFAAASGEAARQHVKDSGAWCDGQKKSGGEEKQEMARVKHQQDCKGLPCTLQVGLQSVNGQRENVHWLRKSPPSNNLGKTPKSRKSANQKEGGRSEATAKARSRAMPTRPRVPSSKRRPIKVMPWGTRRGGENLGRGFFGSGAQSERASETWTKPARKVSEGWPVWLLMVRISSRSDGTSRRSTSENMRAIACS